MSSPLETGKIADYAFSLAYANGATVPDLSGNGRNLTVAGSGITTISDPWGGTAAIRMPKGVLATIASTAFRATASFSVAAVVRFSRNVSDLNIVTFDGDAASDEWYVGGGGNFLAVGVGDTDVPPDYVFKELGGAGVSTGGPNTALTPNFTDDWGVILFTYDATTQVRTFYYRNQAGAEFLWAVTGNAPVATGATGTLTVGNNRATGATPNDIARLTIWNRALTMEDFAAIYDRGLIAVAPYPKYPFAGKYLRGGALGVEVPLSRLLAPNTTSAVGDGTTAPAQSATIRQQPFHGLRPGILRKIVVAYDRVDGGGNSEGFDEGSITGNLVVKAGWQPQWASAPTALQASGNATATLAYRATAAFALSGRGAEVYRTTQASGLGWLNLYRSFPNSMPAYKGDLTASASYKNSEDTTTASGFTNPIPYDSGREFGPFFLVGDVPEFSPDYGAALWVVGDSNTAAESAGYVFNPMLKALCETGTRHRHINAAFPGESVANAANGKEVIRLTQARRATEAYFSKGTNDIRGWFNGNPNTAAQLAAGLEANRQTMVRAVTAGGTSCVRKVAITTLLPCTEDTGAQGITKRGDARDIYNDNLRALTNAQATAMCQRDAIVYQWNGSAFVAQAGTRTTDYPTALPLDLYVINFARYSADPANDTNVWATDADTDGVHNNGTGSQAICDTYIQPQVQAFLDAAPPTRGACVPTVTVQTNGTTVTLAFDRDMDTRAVPEGFALSGGVTLGSGSWANARALNYTASATIPSGATPTWAFTQDHIAADVMGTAVAAASGQSVTNNSTQGGGGPDPGDFDPSSLTDVAADAVATAPLVTALQAGSFGDVAVLSAARLLLLTPDNAAALALLEVVPLGGGQSFQVTGIESATGSAPVGNRGTATLKAAVLAALQSIPVLTQVAAGAYPVRVGNTSGTALEVLSEPGGPVLVRIEGDINNSGRLTVRRLRF